MGFEKNQSPENKICFPAFSLPGRIIRKGRATLKRATAYLLSFCLVFSLAAQTPRAWADETSAPPAAESVTETEQPDDVIDDSSVPDDALTEEISKPEEIPVEDTEDSSIPEDSSSSIPLHDTEELLQTDVEERELEPEKDAVTPLGSLEISVIAALPLQKDTTFQVTLDGPSASSGNLILPAASANTLPVGKLNLTGLEKGTYTVTLRAPGFASYSQSFDVNGLVYEMQLYTDQISGFQSNKRPGVLLIGDVNGNGAIDGADLSSLIDAMENNSIDASCDLNGDGVVDLLDLQLFAGSYNTGIGGQAFLSTRLPAELTQTSAGEQTSVQGDVNNVFQGTGSILLGNTSGTITEGTPAVLDFDFSGEGQSPVTMEGMSIQSPLGTDSTVTQATVHVVYEDADGVERSMDIQVNTAASLARLGHVQQQPDGTLVVDFGGQIAVKKVSLRITATSGSGNLAEISKVEFLNDMENRIPAPQMDIPANVQVENGHREFTVSWDNAVNVTGYEVLVQYGGMQETYKTAVNYLKIDRFAGEKLINQTEYSVQVQSLNGEWRSGYGEVVIARPVATKKPAAPDYLTLNGKFQRIEASWKAMDDTDTYNLYYREAETGEYTCIRGIKTNHYTISGLKNNVRYQVYVTGVNDLGEGDASIVAAASTANVTPPILPAYQWINTSEKAGELTSHITGVTHTVGFMKDSPLDEGNSTSALGVADNDYTSFYQLNDWDDGAAYPDNGGLRFTFDQSYHIGAIALA